VEIIVALVWYKIALHYDPQSDPAERANRQVLEALRAAVATLSQYDQ